MARLISAEERCGTLPAPAQFSVGDRVVARQSPYRAGTVREARHLPPLQIGDRCYEPKWAYRMWAYRIDFDDGSPDHGLLTEEALRPALRPVPFAVGSRVRVISDHRAGTVKAYLCENSIRSYVVALDGYEKWERWSEHSLIADRPPLEPGTTVTIVRGRHRGCVATVVKCGLSPIVELWSDKSVWCIPWDDIEVLSQADVIPVGSDVELRASSTSTFGGRKGKVVKSGPGCPTDAVTVTLEGQMGTWVFPRERVIVLKEPAKVPEETRKAEEPAKVMSPWELLGAFEAKVKGIVEEYAPRARLVTDVVQDAGASRLAAYVRLPGRKEEFEYWADPMETMEFIGIEFRGALYKRLATIGIETVS